MKYPGLVLAGIYILVRVIGFYAGVSDEDYKYFVSFNLLLIVVCVALALYNNYKLRGGKSDFPDEMKASMRAVSIYAIILSTFTFTFYSWIDSGYRDRKTDEYRYNLEQQDYASMPDSENPLLVLGLTKEEFIEREVEKSDRFLSPFAQTTLTLVGIMVVGIIYSLIMVLLRMKLLPLLIRK